MEYMRLGDFQLRSHYDFEINNTMVYADEKKNYQNLREADVNSDDKVTYLEYLNYLNEKNIYQPSVQEIEIASIINLSVDDPRNDVSYKYKVSSDYHCVEITPKEDITINGIDYKADSQLEYYYEDNYGEDLICFFKSGTLKSDTVFNGLNFAGDTGVEFNSNGSLFSGELIEDVEYQDIQIRAGLVSFYDNKVVKSAKLSVNQIVQGLELGSDTEIRFHENGNLRSGYLLEDSWIQGMNYQAGKQVAFYSDGTIQGGFLAEDTRIEGINYKEDGIVVFDNNGGLSLGILAEDTEINGHLLAKDSRITWHESGVIEEGIIKNDTEIYGILIPGKSLVRWNEDGTINQFMNFDQGIVFEDVGCSQIDYYNGKIVQYRIMEPAYLYGVDWPANTLFQSRNGLRVLSPEDVIIDGEVYPGGHSIGDMINLGDLDIVEDR